MRKFIVKYVDPASKKWLSSTVVRQEVVEGENMPHAIRSFYANRTEDISDIKITEIYETISHGGVKKT